MGEAVENLEISPKWRLGQFTALLDAAGEAGARIEGFSIGEGYASLLVRCEGGSPQAFLEAIGRSGEFSGVSLPDDGREDRQTYTIECLFT